MPTNHDYPDDPFCYFTNLCFVSYIDFHIFILQITGHKSSSKMNDVDDILKSKSIFDIITSL